MAEKVRRVRLGTNAEVGERKEAVGAWIHLPEQSREVPSLCMGAMLVPLVSLEEDEQERGSEEPVPVHTWRPLVFALSKASTSTSTSTPW